MALIRQILSGSPDRVFLSVKNASATTMTIGRGVVFDYYSTSTGQDGYNATWRANETSNHLGMLAGIVVHHNIQPGKYGLVQAYGHVDSIYISSSNTANTTLLTGYDATSIGTQILSLITGTLGYFSPVAMAYTSSFTVSMTGLTNWTITTYTQTATATMTVNQYMWQLAGAAVYMGSTCFNGLTQNTYTASTSGNIKGFIRAM